MNSRIRGFSTLELMMVVSVAGVSAAIALPRMSSSIQRTKLERAASMLAADITRARENAKAYGLQQTISFSGTSYTISTVTAAGTTIKSVDLTKEPVESRLQLYRTSGVNFVNFNAYGVPDQEFVIGVNNGNTWRMVTVTAGTGDIDVVTTLPTRFAIDPRNASIGATAAVATVTATEDDEASAMMSSTSTDTSSTDTSSPSTLTSTLTSTVTSTLTSTTTALAGNGNGNGNNTTTGSTSKKAK